jgi:hypothetical protein
MEIANIHGVFAHVAENMTGWFQGLIEYPTLSAIFSMGQSLPKFKS